MGFSPRVFYLHKHYSFLKKVTSKYMIKHPCTYVSTCVPAHTVANNAPEGRPNQVSSSFATVLSIRCFSCESSAQFCQQPGHTLYMFSKYSQCSPTQYVHDICTGEKAVRRLYTWLGRENVFIYLSSIFKVVHEKSTCNEIQKIQLNIQLGIQMNCVEWLMCI